LYENGLCVDQDYKKALIYYNKAANLNHSEAVQKVKELIKILKI